MKIIPAIDLYDGKCVRLNQGDFAAVKTYTAEPTTVAQEYKQQGATEIHVVDLSGAKQGTSQQLNLISKIKATSGLIVQAGGGLRDMNQIEKFLAKDIDRVVIGSLAVTDIVTVITLIEKYGIEKIVLALDIKKNDEPMIAINGWRSTTQQSLWSLLEAYQNFSALRILCTDINRDGMLQGANIELYKMCMNKYPMFQWQASGGISSIADLTALKQIGIAGVIVGKALYENKFVLSQAIAELEPC